MMLSGEPDFVSLHLKFLSLNAYYVMSTLLFFYIGHIPEEGEKFFLSFGYFSFFCKLKTTAENPILLKKRALKNLKS